MDLRDTPASQLTDCVTWLRERATPNTPPSPLVWEELCLEMSERALFIEQFIIPKVPEPEKHAKPLEIIRGIRDAVPMYKATPEGEQAFAEDGTRG